MEVSGSGLLATRMLTRVTSGSVVDTLIGTTAPFSAMSGAVMVMASLAAAALPPSLARTSSAWSASNAASGQAARAAPEISSAPSPAARKVLRFMCLRSLLQER